MRFSYRVRSEKLLACLLAVWALGGSSQAVTSVEGTWKFTRLIDTAAISISPDDSKKFFGKILQLTKPSFSFDGLSCGSNLEPHAVSQKKIRETYKIVDLRPLRLPKKTEEVDADCFERLIRDQNHAIVN